jgi:hypothetical protein
MNIHARNHESTSEQRVKHCREARRLPGCHRKSSADFSKDLVTVTNYKHEKGPKKKICQR